MEEQTQTISLEEHKKIVKILEDELKRRDQIIEDFKQKTNATLKSAIKQASKNQDIFNELDKLKTENEKLRAKLKQDMTNQQ